MTNYIVLDKDEINNINEDQLVVFYDKNQVRTIVCSEKAFEEHKKFWDLEEDKDLIEVK